MKKAKALTKDLKTKFADTLNQAVGIEDPKPSKKVKKIIKRTSKQLASAVVEDTKKARKKMIMAVKKTAKEQKKSLKAQKKSEKSPKIKIKSATEVVETNIA